MRGSRLVAWRAGPGQFDPTVPRILQCAYLGDRTGLEAHLSDVHLTDPKGKSALHLACGQGHVEVVQRLLEAGGNPNLREQRKQRTPVHFAAIRGHVGMMRMLQDAGGELDALDGAKNSCLHLACKHARCDMMAFLIEEAGLSPNARNRGNLLPFDVLMRVPSDHPDRFPALQLLEAAGGIASSG